MSRIIFCGTGTSLPVGKILCLGRNYVAHAREMGAEIPKVPVVFLKPATALIHDGENVVIPRISADLHHEVEMVVIIGRTAKNVQREDALSHVAGYAVGLDMTLRDLQADAKKQGLPWTIAKGFDTSAPVSHAVEAPKVPDPHNLLLSLKVNGECRQETTTANMIFKIDFLISYLSSVFTMEPGDLVFTGTPEGVGPVRAGDFLEAELESVGSLRVGVVSQPTLASN